VPLVRPFYVQGEELEIADDARAQLKDDSPSVLDAAVAALEPISGAPPKPLGGGVEWTPERIEQALREALVDGMGLKPRLAFGPVRTAVSGQRISPPLFESMAILGKRETLARLARLRAEL
jgi:glutamyl-tRNA synthetase